MYAENIAGSRNSSVDPTFCGGPFVSTAETTEGIAPQLSDEDRLILHVGLPRIGSHLDQVARWLDRVESQPKASAAAEMAGIQGAESLAVILRYQQEERYALLHQANLPESAQAELTALLDRFGSTSDQDSPASVVARMFPNVALDKNDSSELP